MKKLFKLLGTISLFCIMVYALALIGCGGEKEQAYLSSIRADVSQVKTEYYTGEAFSAAGLKVYAVYSDGEETEVVAENYNVTPPDMSVVGEKDVKITYAEGEKSAETSFKIKISERQSSGGETEKAISVKTDAVKTVFSAGETFEVTGLEVTLKENEISRVLEADEYTVKGPTTEQMSEVGIIAVTVEYEGLTSGYQIAVVPAVDENSKIIFESSDQNSSLILFVTERTGGGVNTSDASVKGVYLFKDVSGYKFFNFEYSYAAQSWTSTFATKGVYEAAFNDIWSKDNGALFVELGDEEKEFSSMRFKASGNEWHTKVLGWTEVSEITSVSTDGTEFSVSKAFMGEGITVNYNMTDGSSGTITADKDNVNSGKIQFFNADTKENIKGAMLPEGQINVMVMYDSKTFTFVLTVQKGEPSIVVEYSAVIREYLEGAVPSAGGLKVTYIDGNGEQTVLTEGQDGYSIVLPTEEQMAVAGVYEVNVVYGNLSASYQILVIPDVPWETHKVDFGNISNTGDRLELYVTSRPETSDPTQSSTSEGVYVVKRADGGYEVYTFEFSYNPDGAQSTFVPQEGITQQINNETGGGRLEVIIGDATYVADSAYWHRIIIGWTN